VVLALAVLLVACAAPPPPPPPKPAAVPRPDRIVLLPQANGSASALVVRSSSGAVEAVLSQPYATASVSGADVETSMGNAGEVGSRYKTLFKATPAARRSYLVYFDTEGVRLTAESAQRLNDILREVSELPAPEVLVVGHTDTVGISAINDQLSMQRANIVCARLIEKGVNAERIEAVGRDRRELLVPTRDGVAEARNRRVEINVR